MLLSFRIFAIALNMNEEVYTQYFTCLRCLAGVFFAHAVHRATIGFHNFLSFSLASECSVCLSVNRLTVESM